MDSHNYCSILQRVTTISMIMVGILTIPLMANAAFGPLDIPLSEELQEYTYDLCNEYDVPFEVVVAIGENESGWIWPGEIEDTNGLSSVGYMQINYPHWKRLRDDYGVDVKTEKGNIEAGIIILSELLEVYGLEKALVCYQCGITGAKGIESTEFSRKILKRSAEIAT